jgi:hypothetical protein
MMTMLQSCEMRWFFDVQPIDLGQLLTDQTERQERTDWYLLPSNPACGVKLREGLLETKLRCARYGRRQFGSLAGHIEVWKKWSLAFASDQPPSMEELAGTGWIDVDKQRYLQRFAISDGSVSPLDRRPDNGCEFEITELTVGNQTYWTVGFEACGPLDQLEQNLQLAVVEILKRGGLRADFRAENSFGYAHWLNQLDSSGQLPS